MGEFSILVEISEYSKFSRFVVTLHWLRTELQALIMVLADIGLD